VNERGTENDKEEVVGSKWFGLRKIKMTGMQIKDTIEASEKEMQELQAHMTRLEQDADKGSEELKFTGKCLVIFENAKHKEFILNSFNAPNHQNACANAVIRPFYWRAWNRNPPFKNNEGKEFRLWARQADEPSDI